MLKKTVLVVREAYLVKRETSESGNERRFTFHASRVSSTPLAVFFSILLGNV
jgi:hypothetical protein